jgi:hypothetical protein
VRFARANVLFSLDQSPKHAVYVLLIDRRLVFNNDAGFQRALQQIRFKLHVGAQRPSFID